MRLRRTQAYSEHITCKSLGGLLLSATYQTSPLLKSTKIPTDFSGTLISVCKSISSPFKLECMVWAWRHTMNYNLYWARKTYQFKRHNIMYSWAVFQSYSLKQCYCPSLIYSLRFSLYLQGKRFPRSHLKNIKHYKPQEHASEKSSAVSSINSRRSKLGLITYFQNAFLTAPVAWSIFRGKTTALKGDFNLCSYSLYFTAPQRLQILQAARSQD